MRLHSFPTRRSSDLVGDYTSGRVRFFATMLLYLGALVIFALGTIAVATFPFPVKP